MSDNVIRQIYIIGLDDPQQLSEWEEELSRTSDSVSFRENFFDEWYDWVIMCGQEEIYSGLEEDAPLYEVFCGVKAGVKLSCRLDFSIDERIFYLTQNELETFKKEGFLPCAYRGWGMPVRSDFIVTSAMTPLSHPLLDGQQNRLSSNVEPNEYKLLGFSEVKFKELLIDMGIETPDMFISIDYDKGNVLFLDDNNNTSETLYESIYEAIKELYQAEEVDIFCASGDQCFSEDIMVMLKLKVKRFVTGFDSAAAFSNFSSSAAQAGDAMRTLVDRLSSVQATSANYLRDEAMEILSSQERQHILEHFARDPNQLRPI